MSCNILLISCGLTVTQRYNINNIGDISGHLPPLGIAYIAAVAIKNNYSVKALDLSVSNYSFEKILNIINEFKPKIIGFTALTPTFFLTQNLASKIKKSYPEALYILGGHHATLMFRDILDKHNTFDIVVIGEGEETFVDILNKFKNNNYNKNNLFQSPDILQNIKGIAFNFNNKPYKTENRPAIKNLDTLPFPAWSLFPLERYLPLPNQYKNLPIINLCLIRGCVHSCSYCSNASIFGNKIRLISPDKAIEILKYLKSSFGIREISFWDDSFVANKKWLLELCDKIISENLDLSWSCYARVNDVNKNILTKMADAGCWNIFYGMETGNERLLQIINKKITPEQIINAVNWTKEAGIEIRGSFMLGLPGETPEDSLETMQFAIDLDLDYAQFTLTTPYPGTKLYNTCDKYGTLEKNFNKYHMWAPVFIPKGFADYKQLLTLHKRAMRKFYLRPKYILKSIKRIKNIKDLKRHIMGLRFLFGFLFKKNK